MYKDETGGAYSTYGEQNRCIEGFGGNPEGRKPLGRARLT
jgi:hypothetical protein